MLQSLVDGTMREQYVLAFVTFLQVLHEFNSSMTKIFTSTTNLQQIVWEVTQFQQLLQQPHLEEIILKTFLVHKLQLINYWRPCTIHVINYLDSQMVNLINLPVLVQKETKSITLVQVFLVLQRKGHYH